jgi:glycosyltransferase involved in cell wall biosynthesis
MTSLPSFIDPPSLSRHAPLTPSPGSTADLVSPIAWPVLTATSEEVDLRSVESIEQRLADLERMAAELEAAERGDEPPIQLSIPDDFRLSVVVPVYNERSTVRSIVAKLMQLQLPTEVILVDDGSTDGTRNELQRLEGLPNVQIVLKPSNQGKGAALRSGFQHVTGTVVLVQDADLEYDPRDIPRLLEPLLTGQADVVYGSRFLERRWSGSSSLHRLGNYLLTAASNLTTGLQLTDMETCYKVFSADVLNELTVKQNRFGFEPEVTAKLARRGLKFSEVPVRYHARGWNEGKKIGVRDAVSALFCILRYAWTD